MKRLLFLLCLACVSPGRSWADSLGPDITVSPLPGWTLDPDGGTQRYTVAYLPADGRRAKVMITLLPSGPAKVTDLATLKLFHRESCRPLMSDGVENPVHEFPVPDGWGVYATYEDLTLRGKTPPPGEYRFATRACLYLGGRYIVYCTLLTDEASGADFDETLRTAQSVRFKPAAPAASAEHVVTFADRGAVLQVPAGFHRDSRTQSNPTYFSFSNDERTRLTGWLEPAEKYRGFARFWAAEKQALTKRARLTVSPHEVKRIGDWDVALYTVALSERGAAQKNARACRVLGDTWADVHLSVDLANGTWTQLEAVIAGLRLEPKSTLTPATP